MGLVKGDKVKWLDLEGLLISNPYRYVTSKKRCVAVYFEKIEESIELDVEDLVKANG